MSDSSLKFAICKIIETRFPDSLAVPEEIDELCAWTPAKLPNFDKEQEIIRKYEIQKTEIQSRERARELKHNPTPVTIQKAVEVVATPVGAPNAVVNLSPERQLSNGTSEHWCNDQIQKMVKATDQDKETCQFYLESVDWDVDRAIELYRSMTA